MSMKPKQIKVFAPASIGNIGAGFDVLGAAIMQPGDIVVARRVPESGLHFQLHHSSTPVPASSSNVAAHVAQLIIDECRPSFGIALTLHKKMPVGSGLGSSGASCAAAALAVNALLTKPLSKYDLLSFAVEGERIASGTAHADNVAPSLLGGICLIRHYHPLEVIKLPIKNNLFWVVAHPHMIIETRGARGILPKSILLSTASSQLGNIGGLIIGLMTGNKELAGRSIEDHLAEPARAPLIPGFYDVKQAALQSGALGFSISGSGPSVFAVTPSLLIAKQVAHNIKTTFARSAKLKCDIYISRINQQGAKIIGRKS